MIFRLANESNPRFSQNQEVFQTCELPEVSEIDTAVLVPVREVPAS